MTTEQKLQALQVTQTITDVTSKLLELTSDLHDDDPAKEELVLAGSKLLQAQSNILKSVNR